MTLIIIVVTSLISMVAFSKPQVMQNLMMNPYAIKTRQQYYRFVTSGFIHGNHMHLIVNMFSFYFFGTAMESVFGYLFGATGTYYFVALYIMAIVASDLPTYFKERNNAHYNSLGASGGVAAIIFAFIIFMPLQKIFVYFIGIPGFIFGFAYIAYSYYQGRKSQDHINHDAHLYGALFGLVFCVVIHPASFPNFIGQIKGWIESF